MRIRSVTWGKTLIMKLLNITHKQWIYRNSELHYSGREGMNSIAQYYNKYLTIFTLIPIPFSQDIGTY
jgi:hypothetical protein